MDTPPRSDAPDPADARTLLPAHDFEAFRTAALAAGCDEALERHWLPHQVVGSHTHPFRADAVVMRGEMWLTCDGVTRHLRQGDRFSLARGQPHAERYGAEGATFWVARSAGDGG